MGQRVSCCKCSNVRSDYDNELESINPRTVDFFSFENQKYQAKIVEVTDSTKVIFIFLWNDSPIKLRGRIHGYACPESSSTATVSARRNLQLASQKCTDYLNSLVGPKDDEEAIVNIKIIKAIEDGHYLIEVNLPDGTSVLNSMLGFGAKSFYGSKSDKGPDFTTEELKKIIERVVEN